MSVPPRTRAWWATVAGRVGRRVLIAALLAAGLLLGAVGVVAVPPLLPCWFVVGAVAGGVLYARLVERTKAVSPGARRACRHVSIAVGVVTMVGCLVVVGLVYLLGPVSGPVVLVLVLVGAPWLWRGLRRARAWTPAAPVAPPAVRDVPVIAAAAAPGASTAELCLAWRRSYLALLDTPCGPDRDRIVELRRELLDELHRRDPDGFSRWIDTGARAGGDPGRYLGTGR